MAGRIVKTQKGCGCDGSRGGQHIVLVYGGKEYRLPETPDVKRLVHKLAMESLERRPE